MQKNWIERIKIFFRADVLEECRATADRKNITMLCVVNLAMGMFALMLCGHIRADDHDIRFLYACVLLFVISVLLFFINQRIVAKRPRMIFWMIVCDYIIWIVCIISGSVVMEAEIYAASYLVLTALGCCFLMKPLYLIGFQVVSAALICIQLPQLGDAQMANASARSICAMMVLSIVLGLFVLYMRMSTLKENEEAEKIRQISTLYQSILDETQTGVYVRELGTYEILYINRKACEIFGLDAKSAVGLKCYQLLYHQNVACRECPARFRNIEKIAVREVMLNGHTYAVKSKIIDWSGREAYVEYLTDVTDAKKVSEQMRLAHDSLERKYEEEVLYREKAVSEDILSTSRLNLSAGIVEELRVGKQDGFEDMYRHTMEFRERIESFCKDAWILDEQNRRLSREGLLEQFEQGETKIYEEYIAELKDGKHVWVRTEANLLRRPETSEVMAFMYNRDITRERLLGHVLERIMSFEYDEIYTIDSANSKFELIAVGQYALDVQQLSGEYEEKLDSLIDRAVVEEDKEKILRELCIENMCKVLHEEQTQLLEVTLVSKSGKARRKRIRCMYLYEDVGTVLVTITDIDDVVTAEKEKQEQLEEALSMAQEASRAKSSFLASMSHEIRTPMNAIIGLNSIVKENLDDREHVLDCSDKLDSASKYLLALLNDILDMSRIESGNMTLVHQPFDGDKFWENVNTLAQTQADIAGVKYIFKREREMSRVYLGDATRLQQIMINLISNAIKFSDENGIVKVSVTETEEEETRAAIDVTVEDNGIGISEEFLPEVFGTFTQEHSGSTTAYKGSGLGLSIARNFARMMDGDITVTSREGVGTRFTVHVLLDMDREQPGIVEQDDKSEERMFNGKKILLVEDHPLNTIVAKSLLTKRGFEVVYAENGEDALRYFAESEVDAYDAILMDIRMPVMDGIEATIRLRALEREDASRVPIIAMTANAYEEDRKQTAEAGMDAHLAKPIDPKQLFRTLDEFIRE